jgi:hypothetical protein
MPSIGVRVILGTLERRSRLRGRDGDEASIEKWRSPNIGEGVHE